MKNTLIFIRDIKCYKMSEIYELNINDEKICCLCGTPQNERQLLFVEGSDELNNLVICIYDLLRVHDIDMSSKWLCSSCPVQALNVKEFLELVKSGLLKLRKLKKNHLEIETSEELKECDEIINRNNEAIVDLKEPYSKDKKCIQSKKRVSKKPKNDFYDEQDMEFRKKRLRRKPQRFLEEIEYNPDRKVTPKAAPLVKVVENEIDSCALITSQPIAELRTANGNALGEIVQVDPNEDKENLNSSSKTYFICEYCKAVFNRQSAFLKHIETHKNCVYECNECLETFGDKSALAQHQSSTGHKGCGIIEDILGEKKVERDNDPTNDVQNTALDETKNIKIEKIANETLKNCEELVSEFAVTANNLKSSIDDSTKDPTNKGSKKYVCLVCSKSFDYPYAVRRHFQLTHIAERNHKCTLCSAAFKTKYNYNLHLAAHKGEKNFSCHFCPKAFLTKHEWKVHNRVHTGEKPYKCLICSKSFTNRCNLTTHKRIHTGERPYRCPTCNTGFKSTSHLKTHERVHLKREQNVVKMSAQEIQLNQKTSKVKGKALHLRSDLESSEIPIKTIEIPISLLKPRITKPVENHSVTDDLPELPTISSVQILPTIPLKSTENALSADLKQALASANSVPELPLIKNIQILPAITDKPGNRNQLKVHSPSTKKQTSKQLVSSTSTKPSSFKSVYKYECPYCSKKFKQTSAMHKHQRTHTGERPYKCPVCPKSFADPSNFKKHRMLHKNVTNALITNANVAKSSTMQELRQMLEEQSITITSSHAAAADSPSTYAASDPDPDGMENFSRSLPCPSEFDHVEGHLTQNSGLSASMGGNAMSLNRAEPSSTGDVVMSDSLINFKNFAVGASTAAEVNTDQLVCISYQDPDNPIAKTTTYYVVK